MNASDWITRSVSRLRPGSDAAEGKKRAATEAKAKQATKTPASAGPRPLAERLEATLRRHGEALAPRALRRALTELQAVVDPRVSEVEAGRRAHAVVQWYAGRELDERR
ncbi:MAG TPA: malonyl-CoA decarboxylase, partial [Ramlibacter sp.]|nr:malonyl-CoA decarboxylase [Ramlibacter sp.]